MDGFVKRTDMKSLKGKGGVVCKGLKMRYIFGQVQVIGINKNKYFCFINLEFVNKTAANIVTKWCKGKNNIHY